MEKLGDSKQQVVDNVREDETILHFQKSVQIPCFIFPRNSVVSSFTERKNYLLKHEKHHA